MAWKVPPEFDRAVRQTIRVPQLHSLPRHYRIMQIRTQHSWKRFNTGLGLTGICKLHDHLQSEQAGLAEIAARVTEVLAALILWLLLTTGSR
jgi:hypothetical protein